MLWVETQETILVRHLLMAYIPTEVLEVMLHPIVKLYQ